MPGKGQDWELRREAVMLKDQGTSRGGLQATRLATRPDCVPLGATYLGERRCSFCVWAPSAELVEVHVISPYDRMVPLAETGPDTTAMC